MGAGMPTNRTGLRRAPASAAAAPSRPRRTSSGSISGSRPRRSRNASIGSTRPAARQQPRAERVAVRALQAAVLAEPLDGVGVEHLGPDVRVVAGRVAAAEDVVEVGRAVARRHRREVDAGRSQRGRLERLDLLDVRRDLVGRRAGTRPGRAARRRGTRSSRSPRRPGGRPAACPPTALGMGSPVSWCSANARTIDGSHAQISLTCDGYSTKSRGTSVPDCDGHRTAESRPCSA